MSDIGTMISNTVASTVKSQTNAAVNSAVSKVMGSLPQNAFSSSINSAVYSAVNGVLSGKGTSAATAAVKSVVRNGINSLVQAGVSQARSAVTKAISGGINSVLSGQSLLQTIGLTSDVQAAVSTANPGLMSRGVASADNIVSKINSGELNAGNFDTLVPSISPTSAADFASSISITNPTITNSMGYDIRNVESVTQFAADNYTNFLVSPEPSGDDTAEVPLVSYTSSSSSTNNNLPTALSGGQNSIVTSDPSRISSYAKDLADHFYTLKHDFMYVVGFDLNPPFNAILEQYNNFSHLAHKVTRPEMKVDFDEVNMYNFHTQVPKRVIYEPLHMDLYDDEKSGILEFIVAYMQLISPLMRISGKSLAASGDIQSRLEHSVLRFLNDKTYGAKIASSLSALAKNQVSIIKQIHVFHIHTGGSMYDQYTYTNPKFMNVKFSELDMANDGGACTLSIDMTYDALYIEPKQFFNKSATKINAYIKPNILKILARPPASGTKESKVTSQTPSLYPTQAGSGTSAGAKASSSLTSKLTSQAATLPSVAGIDVSSAANSPLVKGSFDISTVTTSATSLTSSVVDAASSAKSKVASSIDFAGFASKIGSGILSAVGSAAYSVASSALSNATSKALRKIKI